MTGQSWEDLRWVSGDRQGSDPTDVGSCQTKGFLPIERVIGLPKGDLQGARLGTFDVDPGFVDANAIQTGPEQRM